MPIINMSNKDLPQHNQGVLEKFIENDMTSHKPYFLFLKMNDGGLHMLSNLFSDEDALNLIEKEFIKIIKEARNELKSKR